MGLILDSSVLIAAERQARSISELLSRNPHDRWVDGYSDSAVSVIELEHGFWRANATDIAGRRRVYLDGIFTAIPMGQLAAKIDAETRRQGIVISFADLQIGVTALVFDYAVMTLNVRHFEAIPSLRV